MVNPIITTTLPTIVGMGVVSRTTEVMFDRQGRRIPKSKAKRQSASIIVGISTSKAGAENYARGYRKSLKRQGKPYAGRVKVKKVQGGYAAVYFRG